MADSDQDQQFIPVTQSREAFDYLSAFGNDQVEESVTRMAQRVREIAPETVALSLSIEQGELTFTVTTDRPGAALMDAMQYLDGGPCVRSVTEGTVEITTDLPTDEGRWQMFAKAKMLTGISSTLSLPIVRDGHTVGGVNLYGATNDAFDGHLEELAEVCGGWAEGAITNADLGFTSRVRAATAPDRLQSRGDVDIAVGVVAQHQDVEVPEARDRIHA